METREAAPHGAAFGAFVLAARNHAERVRGSKRWPSVPREPRTCMAGVVTALAAASCAAPTTHTAPVSSTSLTASASSAVFSPPRPDSIAPVTTRRELDGVPTLLQRFRLDLRRVQAQLIDVGATGTLEPAAAVPRLLLAIDGGFFDERREPLGLAISDGRVLAPLRRALSGGVLEIDDDRAQLFASERYEATRKPRFALQCRPRLVVDGRANVRSDDGHRAERTAVCVRDGGATIDVVLAHNSLNGPSLFALAQALSEDGCEQALALDGGPSTGALYATNNGLVRQPPRGPIRHAVVFTAR